jgi:hypothetical protein
MFLFDIGDPAPLGLDRQNLEVIVLVVKVTMVMGSVLSATTTFIGKFWDWISAPAKKLPFWLISGFFPPIFSLEIACFQCCPEKACVHWGGLRSKREMLERQSFADDLGATEARRNREQ